MSYHFFLAFKHSDSHDRFLPDSVELVKFLNGTEDDIWENTNMGDSDSSKSCHEINYLLPVYQLEDQAWETWCYLKQLYQS